MINEKFEFQINRLRKVNILNQKILNKLSSLDNIDKIETLVNTYLRYYEALIKINDRCNKLKVQFDFDQHLRNVHFLSKGLIDKYNCQLTNIETEIKLSSPVKKEYRRSVYTVSGGLPTLGKKR